MVDELPAPRQGEALESLRHECAHSLPLSPLERSEQFAMDSYEVELCRKEILRAIRPTWLAS